MAEIEVPVATLVVAGDNSSLRDTDAAAVLFDLAETVEKTTSRGDVTDVLVEGAVRRLVRVNDWTTHWTYRDVIEVVEGAGENVAAIVLPKVHSAHDVVALDRLLTQIETTMELAAGAVGIVAQLDDARGLQVAATLAAASPRLCGLATTVVGFSPTLLLAAQADELPAFAFAADVDEIERIHDEGFDAVWVDDPALVAVADEVFDASA